ncbi:MAG: hypothetical protein ABH878_07180, partial [bacterium]
IALQRILGVDYPIVNRELLGFLPNKTIHLDGVSIDVEKLEEVANNFELGKYLTRSIHTE